jgi:hypothetical protein
MNSTLAYLRGRRAWLVENLSVWGVDSEAEFLMAAVERVGSETRLGFWRMSLGGNVQEVSFASLIDNRGNHLPPTIKKPAVVVIPRGRCGAFVKSVNGESGFAVAKTDSGPGATNVDVMIFETGL